MTDPTPLDLGQHPPRRDRGGCGEGGEVKENDLPFNAPLVERPMVRHTDPCTSEGAAAVVRPELGQIQRLVLEVYRQRGPMTARTAERLPEFLAYGFSTIRKRISELASAGLLVSVGIDTTGRAPCTIYDHVERSPKP